MQPTDKLENAGRTPGDIASLPSLDRSHVADTGYARTADMLPPGESTADGTSITISEEDIKRKNQKDLDDWCIQQARTCFTVSTDYITANVTQKWERSLSHFQSRHGSGRPYSAPNYKRSRVFRPKTRTSIKGQEAALTAAVFSTLEAVNVEALNPQNQEAVASAAINKALMNYRLHRGTIPWFLTTVGAFQDTKVYGLCVSHQYWDYRVDTQIIPAVDQDGQPVMGDSPSGPVAMGVEKKRVRADRPVCDLLEPENFRFDPMADWRDPIGTSPYLIMLKPMYAGEVMEMMELGPSKTGQAPWRKYDMGQILSTRRELESQTRRAREGTRTDPAQEQVGNAYTTLWAHLNIIRVDGDDLAYWTLGTELVMTEPVLLSEMYPHLREGERPFVLGISAIEAHKNYPAGDVEQGSGLQEEINDIANQRMDNVKLVLNKRYHVRRGSQVDLDALIRNVPGGGVHMNDIEKDVKVVNTPDVTGSSYQEQDRLSVEFDDMLGSFSQSSVMNNRNLNETVGGMDKMGSSANSITDYGIRIFLSTWIEKVLSQLVRMEQMYETDEVVLAIAADDSKLFTKFGFSAVTDSLLRHDLHVQGDLGIGNTDPIKRVERLIFGISKTAEIPGVAERIKGQAVTQEVFGALGYRNGKQFIRDDEEQAQWDKDHPQPMPPEIQVKMEELKIRKADNEARDKRETIKMQADIELGYAALALQKGLKLEEMYTKLGVEKAKLKSSRDIAALTAMQKINEQNIQRSQSAGSEGSGGPPGESAEGPPQG